MRPLQTSKFGSYYVINGRERALRILTLVCNMLVYREAKHLLTLKGDTIHVIGTFSKGNHDDLREIIVDEKDNFVILEPDILVPTTAISNSKSCRRRVLLSNSIQTLAGVSPPTQKSLDVYFFQSNIDISGPSVYEAILHDIFFDFVAAQNAMSTKKEDTQSISTQIRSLVATSCEKFALELKAMNIDSNHVAAEMEARVLEYPAYADLLLQASNSNNNVCFQRNFTRVKCNEIVVIIRAIYHNQKASTGHNLKFKTSLVSMSLSSFPSMV